MATMSDYRQMLLTHLQENDPLTLRQLRTTGELEEFLGMQLDAVKNLRESNPPRPNESPSQKALRTEIEAATLLEYPKPIPDPLEDPSEQTARERGQLVSMFA